MQPSRADAGWSLQKPKARLRCDSRHTMVAAHRLLTSTGRRPAVVMLVLLALGAASAPCVYVTLLVVPPLLRWTTLGQRPSHWEGVLPPVSIPQRALAVAGGGASRTLARPLALQSMADAATRGRCLAVRASLSSCAKKRVCRSWTASKGAAGGPVKSHCHAYAAVAGRLLRSDDCGGDSGLTGAAGSVVNFFAGR